MGARKRRKLMRGFLIIFTTQVSKISPLLTKLWNTQSLILDFYTLTTMTTEPLLLAARELARGSVASLPVDYQLLASTATAMRLAVLFRSQTERSCLRLSVFKADEDKSVENYELADLLTDGDEFEIAPNQSESWTLVWSPDLSFLIISGQISRAGGASEGSMWLFACPEWLIPTKNSQASQADMLLLRMEPTKQLVLKHWNPAANIVSVFFPTQNESTAFVLSADGNWLYVSIDLAKLSLAAMNAAVLEDKTDFFTMKVVKKLTEWHAGVSAVCYDPKTLTLVVSGGVRDPSADLVKNQAASLSVWKVVVDKNNKDVGELLDFTMIFKKNITQHVDEEGINESEKDRFLPINEDSGGILTSVKSTLFAPLRMLMGGETTGSRVLRGWIRHLMLAPNGNFVSMVNDLGHLAIRQIDVCTDVLNWQSIGDLSAKDCQDLAIKLAVWLTSDLIALVLTNNSVVYASFTPCSVEATSDENDQPTGRLVLTPAQHYRPLMGAGTDSVDTLALNAIGVLLNSVRSNAFSAYEFVVNDGLWAANQIQNLAAEPFLEMLINAHKYDDALATVRLYNMSGNAINTDSIHLRIWMEYRKQAGRLYDENKGNSTDLHVVFLLTRPQEARLGGQRDEFVEALDHLRAVSDKRWILRECMTLIADDSSASMKKILNLAWDACISLNDDDRGDVELLQEREKLQCYLYRLETLRLLLCAEEGISTTSVASDKLFDGTTYAVFRVSPIFSTAKQLALEGRISALTLLFQRHGRSLLPRWLEVLNFISPFVSPSTYALLLPAIPTQIEDDIHFYTLCRSAGLDLIDGNEDYDLILPFRFDPKIRLQDQSNEELLTFTDFIGMSHEERNFIYGKWFVERILELDESFGQLAFAYKLSELALQCLREWPAMEARKALEELVLNTERLYKCVYLLHISACSLLPLSEWCAMSLHDQATIVVGFDGKEKLDDVALIIDRFNAVFVSQRRGRTYALDELIAWLAQTMASKASLIGLALAAQLMQRSNPSIDLADRFIQSNATLIENALGVIYSVDASKVTGDDSLSVNKDIYVQRHHAFVEQLWIIFQSLPVRNEHDSPEIAQLQVAVDEIEDLMVAMDVLAKYDIIAFPSNIKFQMLVIDGESGGVVNDGGPLGLLEQMCEFALPGASGHWLEVLQDALQLKEHAFGERLSQENILNVILKHLLGPGCVDVDAAQNLVNHWIASDIEAVDNILKKLLTIIRGALDSVVGYSEDATADLAHKTALGCINISEQLLALPLWDDGDRAATGAKQRYEEMMSQATDVAYACELLDLLTHGAVKLSPLELRADKLEEQDKIRLHAVCQVFVSNPTNYKPSMRAKEWLAQHHVGDSLLAKTDDHESEPLASVMHLAKLLRVESKWLQIWMKGAYAALNSTDYDVACHLTLQVINELPADVVVRNNTSDSQLTPLNLVSLVLDLVSASSFGSLSKKHQLCLSLLKAATVSSLDLFAHQATDLLLSWLEKIEAMQALMVELGLSESDLEQRRYEGGKITISAAVALMNELKVVVDLLHEEKNDRHFLIALLQRGFRLTQVMLNDVTGVENELSSTSVSSFLQQVVQLCVEEAIELISLATTSKSKEWQQYVELGLSHLMLWSDFCIDDAEVEAFCTDLIISSASAKDCESDSSEASEVLVRRFHHFFLLLAAQAKEYKFENDKETLIARRKRLEMLTSSYDAVRKAVNFTGEPVNGALSEVTSVTEQLTDSQLLVSDRRYHIYMRLAQQCHECLNSHKDSVEMGQISAIFNTELDLKRFSQDESYRSEMIMVLATRKNHLQFSRQLASKYGLDDYSCVLAYIKDALLFPSSVGQMDRREQLDHAFAIEQSDILEEALQRPSSFGNFLLKNETIGEPSLYEAIEGTDHVGMLLVLRMILECSKRLKQETTDLVSSQEHSLFPLSQPLNDRITLLFMCLKKLKDIGDSLENVDVVDLKLIGAASTSSELLTPLTSSRTDSQTTIAHRKMAVEAVRPLLTSKSIKLVTKILRKLYRVTPSAMVMIYIKNLLTSIWKERGTDNSSEALSADLAVYAYESCIPCLSVLSCEHLMLFYYLFLSGSSNDPLPEPMAHLNLEEEFYGQRLDELSLFGPLLTPQKRVELVADTLTMLQTKYNSWQNSGSQSNVSSTSSTSSASSVSWDPTQFKRIEQQLHYLERELAENVCVWVLSEIQQKASITSTQSLTMNIKACFAMDSEQLRTANEKDILHNVLLELCQCIACVELASLIMELTLRFGIRKAGSEESTSTILQMYQHVVVNLIQRCVGNEGEGQQSADWVDNLVWSWVTSSCSPNSSQKAELMTFLEGTCDLQPSARVTYERVLKKLSQSTSNLLKEIGFRRLQELQASNGENDINSASVVKAARQALVCQWNTSIEQYEEKHKWAEAATLGHVLGTSAKIDGAGDPFGLCVKAIWAALLAKYRFDENTDEHRIFMVPTRDVLEQFTDVFEELLAFIEVRSDDAQFAEMATMALSHLLVRHDDLKICSGAESTAQRCMSVWQREQEFGIQTRVHKQFRLGSVTERKAFDNNNSTCWSALFARGLWGTHLLSWYTAHAYAELSSEEKVTEAVILRHWEINDPNVAIQLLLMCPFDGLREKYADRALAYIRQVPLESCSWSTIMELVLLRFDVPLLLQHDLYSSIVAFVLQDASINPALWTSSGGYVLCALVTLGEFAAAGRITCALRHAHPLLWDVENARLLLVSYLRSLASAPVQSRNGNCNPELIRLQHEVYAQAFRHLSDKFL